ncbi:hypothetical protein SFRURICE_016967 [Spodoptera frugiperda]|nr:hypothetical protein SFRURICE_016967 [Spodoptera frugiperda]
MESLILNKIQINQPLSTSVTPTKIKTPTTFVKMKFHGIKKFRKVKILCVQIVTNNKLDEDIKQMLKPLDLIQLITFYPKYSIKNNKLTPNTLLTDVFTLLVTFLYSSAHICGIYYNRIHVLPRGTITTFVNDIASVVYCVGFLTSFSLSVMRTHDNIALVMTIQSIHRILNTDKIYFKRFVLWNWIYSIMILSFYIIVITYFTVTLNMSPLTIFCSLCHLTYDINQIYTMRIINFLENKVETLRANILKFGNMEERESLGYIEEHFEKLFTAYKDVWKCYDLLQSLFQLPMLYVTVQLVIQTLIQIQLTLVLVAMKMSFFLKLTIVQSLCLWMSKNVILFVLLNKNGENFYRAMEDLRETCIKLLGSSHYVQARLLFINSYKQYLFYYGTKYNKTYFCFLIFTEPERRMLKNILRIQTSSRRKLNVFGLFDVDAKLYVVTLTIIANYTFVLLQFAFGQARHNLPYRCNSCKPGSTVDTNMKTPEY